MTVQATVGGAVLGTSLGAGVARVSAASVGRSRFSAASVGGAREHVTGSGRVVAQAGQELAMTGSSHTVLILTAALMVLALGWLLNGLGRRHATLGLAGPHPGRLSPA
ncbi:MAG: hypothetical protein M3137_07695 [Actinomycetota bacterium]|nr:hypothetical protein [Actinomycetota bacterium]